MNVIESTYSNATCTSRPPLKSSTKNTKGLTASRTRKTTVSISPPAKEFIVPFGNITTGKSPTAITSTTLTKTKTITLSPTYNACPKANIKYFTWKPANATKSANVFLSANVAGKNTSDTKAGTTHFAQNNAATKAVWRRELAPFAGKNSQRVVGKKQNTVHRNAQVKHARKTKRKFVRVVGNLSMHVGILAHKNIVRSSVTSKHDTIHNASRQDKSSGCKL